MITAEQLNILITATNTASREFAVVRRDFNRMSRDLTRAGRTLTRTLTLPLLAIGAAATKTAITFDDEMTKIITLVGVAEQQVDQWRESVLALGPAVGRGPTELARALFVVTSAGERGANALKVVEQAAMAAAIGLGDAAVTARAVTAAMQAYKDDGLSAARATEILVATVREGNLVAEDLAGSLGRVLGAASLLGVEFEEVGGFIATFTRLGVSAEESTTSLRQIFASMLKPMKDTEDALATAGLSAAMLRDQLGRDGLVSVLELLMEKFGGNLDVLAKVIPNIRALTGVLGTAGVQGEAFAEINENIANSLGIVEEGFRRVQQTPAQQWKVFTAEAQKMGIELGAKLIPTFLTLIDTVRGVFDEWNTLSESTQTVIIRLAGVAAIVGPLALALGGLTKAIALLYGALAFGSTSLVAAGALASNMFLNLRLVAMGAAKGIAATNIAANIFHGTILSKVIPTMAALLPVLAAATAAYLLFDRAMRKAEQEIDEATAATLRARAEFDKVTATIAELNETNHAAWLEWRRLKNELIASGKEPALAYQIALRQIQASLAEAAEAAKKAGEDIGDALAPADVAAQELSKTIQEMGAEMKANFETAQELKRVFGDAFDLTAENVGIAQAAIRSFIEAGADMNTVVGEGGFTLGQLAEWYNFLEKSIADATAEQTRFNRTVSAVQSILGQIESPLETYNRLLNEAKALRIQMPFIFSQADFDAYVALLQKNLRDAVAPVAQAAAISGEEVGRAIVEGIVRGIRDDNLGASLERVVWQLVEKGIIAIITGGLGFASPSKLAIGWGRSVVEGFAIGLSGADAINTAVDALVTEVSGIDIPTIEMPAIDIPPSPAIELQISGVDGIREQVDALIAEVSGAEIRLPITSPADHIWSSPVFAGVSVGAGAGGGSPAPASAGPLAPAAVSGQPPVTQNIYVGFGTEGERLLGGRAAEKAYRDNFGGRI